MSKTVEWNPEFGTGGTLTCTCDNCGKSYKFKFKSKPDYKGCGQKLKEKYGWFPRKYEGQWYDLCSDECKDELEEKIYDGSES